MVRNYKRKTERGNWTAASLEAAVKAVKDGVPVREVSIKFKIPRWTLRDRITKATLSDPKQGRKTIFCKEQEDELTNHFLLLSKTFHGVTPMEARRIAYEYAEMNNIPNVFHKGLRLAGRDWLKGFLKRASTMSLRKPEGTSVNRISGFNKDAVKRFYDNLKCVVDSHSFDASRIFNVDETGISSVPTTKPRLLAPKGQKQVGIVTSAERGKNTTKVCCFSAAGTYVPPMFIFARQRMTQLLEKDGPIGAIYNCSKSGWMTETLFSEWLRHFQKSTQCSKENPVLLILDNHTSHISLDMFVFCRDNGIFIVTLPPHTSHKLQPLDVIFYAPLKLSYSRECYSYMKAHPYQKITPYDIASLFNKAYIRTATMEKGIKGFQITGIFPFDPDVFSPDDFSYASEELDMPSNSTEQVTTESIFESSISKTTTIWSADQPGPSGIRLQHVAPILSADQPGPSGIKLQQIAPVPSAKKSKNSGKRKQMSEIITASPFKIRVLEKDKNRKKKENTKCKKLRVITKSKPVKKRIKYDSSDSESSQYSVDDEGLNDEISSEEDICIICGEFGGKEMWYRCTLCGKWAHKVCTGVDTPKNYVCDFCK